MSATKNPERDDHFEWVRDAIAMVVLAVIAYGLARLDTPVDRGWPILFGVLGSFLGIIGCVAHVSFRREHRLAVRALKEAIEARRQAERFYLRVLEDLP